MKAIVITGPNQLEWQELPLPLPGPGQIRIRTGACGVCATDLLMMAGWERTRVPSIPGHEWAGTVDAVGEGATPGLVGRRCVGENALSVGGEVGFEHPGGYGEYFLTEARNIYPLPDDFSFAAAALMEPLAVAVRAINKLRIADINEALIFGDGTIGQIMLLLLRRAGVKQVFLVGGRQPRLALANDLGAHRVLDYHTKDSDLAGWVLHTAGRHFPLVIEASGSGAAMDACLELVELCGQVMVLGDYGAARASFEWNHLLHREIAVIGSNASAGAWGEAVRLAISGDLNLKRLVSHRFPAVRFAEAIEVTRQRESNAMKVVMEW
jgi:2-desacetyl-2-hydroxyethyl bacteriochlorophyllide A dehydrogenase